MVLVQDFWNFYFEESSIKTLTVKKITDKCCIKVPLSEDASANPISANTNTKERAIVIG